MGEEECKCAISYAGFLRTIGFVKDRLAAGGGFDLERAKSLVKGSLTVDLDQLQMHCGVSPPKRDEDLNILLKNLEIRAVEAAKAMVGTIDVSVAEGMAKCAYPDRLARERLARSAVPIEVNKSAMESREAAHEERMAKRESQEF